MGVNYATIDQFLGRGAVKKRIRRSILVASINLKINYIFV